MNETTNAVRDVKVIEAVKTLNDVGLLNWFVDRGGLRISIQATTGINLRLRDETATLTVYVGENRVGKELTPDEVTALIPAATMKEASEFAEKIADQNKAAQIELLQACRNGTVPRVKLICDLMDCEDVMPAEVCAALYVPEGSTYGDTMLAMHSEMVNRQGK